MRLVNIWGKKAAISALVVFSLAVTITPAKAIDTSGDARFGELAASIAATKDALYSAESLSITETSSTTFSAKSFGKGTTRIIVTPTISEYYSRDYQSADKKKTWQLTGINSHVYTTKDKVYTELSDDHSWSAGYNSQMAVDIRKFSPFTATWVVSDRQGPNQNYNAMEPASNAASYIQGLDAVSDYISVVTTMPDLWVTTGLKGEKIYIVDFAPQFPSLIYTYKVDPVTGYVFSFGFTNSTGRVKMARTYQVAIGDSVTAPVFDPASLNSIDQTEILKKVRGLSAQEILRTPAELVINIATASAKKLRKPVTAALVLESALNTFGATKVSAVTGGARLLGTFDGEVGYLCVLVKSGKVSIKACK